MRRRYRARQVEVDAADPETLARRREHRRRAALLAPMRGGFIHAGCFSEPNLMTPSTAGETGQNAVLRWTASLRVTVPIPPALPEDRSIDSLSTLIRTSKRSEGDFSFIEIDNRVHTSVRMVGP